MSVAQKPDIPRVSIACSDVECYTVTTRNARNDIVRKIDMNNVRALRALNLRISLNVCVSHAVMMTILCYRHGIPTGF